MFLGECRRLVRRAETLTAFVCRLLRTQGASISWNPVGLKLVSTGTALHELSILTQRWLVRKN